MLLRRRSITASLSLYDIISRHMKPSLSYYGCCAAHPLRPTTPAPSSFMNVSSDVTTDTYLLSSAVCSVLLQKCRQNAPLFCRTVVLLSVPGLLMISVSQRLILTHGMTPDHSRVTYPLWNKSFLASDHT